MMDESDFAPLDYKDGDGEFDLVVNMRHRVFPMGKSTWFYLF